MRWNSMLGADSRGPAVGSRAWVVLAAAAGGKSLRGSLLVGVLLAPLMAGADEAPPVAETAVPATSPDAAGEPDRPWTWWLDNEYYKLTADVRARAEFANIDDLDFSQAWTVRTRLGLGNKPWHGLSAYVEGEGTFSFAPDAYWNVVSTPNGKTPIADPVFIELNRGWLQYANKEFADVSVKAGRQRIKLDDDRFIGNVGWRQNEQTYDSARGGTSFGVEGLKLDYAYAWLVHRIFANKGGTARRDWDSRTHMIRLHYGGLDFLKVTGFAYLVDLTNDAPGFSSNSYGFRATGSIPLGDDWKIGYIGSYAYQTDAAQNPVNYSAHYAWASADVGYAPIATVGAGYELLGSDDGKARFVTPLATLHKFNGFADMFLDNGGRNGLQDFFAYVSPKLPWKIKGKLIYHRFWSDEGSNLLGDEIDFVAKRKFGKYTTVLLKTAWFWDNPGAITTINLRNIYRVTMETTFKF